MSRFFGSAAGAVAVCQVALDTARARAKEVAPRLAALQLVAERNPWLNFGVVAAALAPSATHLPPSPIPTLAPTATHLPPSEIVVPAGNGVDQDQPAYAVVFDHRRLPLTLAALVRIAARDEGDTAAAVAVAEAEAALTAAQGKARTAAQVHELARLTATVQSDYASQVEMQRIHTRIRPRALSPSATTSSSPSSFVGYKPYTEMMKKAGRSKKNQKLEPVRKQHIDIF